MSTHELRNGRNPPVPAMEADPTGMPWTDACVRTPGEGSTATTRASLQAVHARVEIPVPAPGSRTTGDGWKGTNSVTAGRQASRVSGGRARPPWCRPALL